MRTKAALESAVADDGQPESSGGGSTRPSHALARLLVGHVGPYRRPLIGAALLQVCQAAALLYLPTLNARMINDGVVAGDIEYVWRIGTVMLVVSLLQAAATIFALHLSVRTAMGMGRDIRAVLFRHVQRLSSGEVQRIGAPSLLTRTSNDVQHVQMLMLSLLTVAITGPAMAIGGITMALVQDVALSWLMVGLVLLLATLVAVLIGKMRPMARIIQDRTDATNRVLREQITGIRVTRAFVQQDFERARFAQVNEGLTHVSIRHGRLNALFMPVVINTVNLGAAAAVWIGGLRIDSGDMQIGTLVAFLVYLVMVQSAVLSASRVVMQLPRGDACAGRIQEVLETESSVAAAMNPTRRIVAPGRVELHGVSFRYPAAEDDVLHHVDLTFEVGTTVAITGSTGSGKSTLLALVCRLLDPTEGRVLVGGADVRQLDPGWLSQVVTVVPQRPQLFSGTVASNLRFGRTDATDADLWRVLDIAQASDFVADLDGRLEARVSQGGANLSGGQRQRLAIARALLRSAQIYLFDDAFSALDYCTEANLRQRLARDLPDATFLVVAQRLHTIRGADRIVVLDAGRVAGSGTHRQLLRSSSVYGEIVRSQLGEEPLS